MELIIYSCISIASTIGLVIGVKVALNEGFRIRKKDKEE